MEAVGRLGSYLSERVYTVAAPFDPFGGAVDIIVVQQEDGTYRSSPWYVKFGKFQGVLKRREKIVNVSVNGVEANFHMFLDHRGVAYFLQELDNNEEESGFSPPSAPSSGDESGAKKNNRPPSGSKKNNSPLRKNGDPTEENDTLETEDVSALSYGSPDHQDNNEEDIKRMSSGRSDVSRQSSQLLSDTSGSMLSNERSISMVPSRRSSIFNLFRGRSRSYSEAHVTSSQNESIQRISSLERAEHVTDLIDSKWAIGISDKTRKVSAEKDYEMNSFSSSDNNLVEEDEFPGPVDKVSGDLSCCEKADDSDASPHVVKARDTEKFDLDAADYNVVVNDTMGESSQQNALESGQTNEFKLQEFPQTSLGNPNTCISKLDYASQSDVMKFQHSEEINIFVGEPEHKEFCFLEHVSFPGLFEFNDDNDVQIVETNIGQLLFEETKRIRVKLVTQDSSVNQEPYNTQDRSLIKSLLDSNLDGHTGNRTMTEDLMTMPEELIPEVKVSIEYESEFCFTKRKDGKASPEECLISLEQNQPKVVDTDTVAIELNETMDNELGKATLVALPSDKLSRSKDASESAKQCNCIDIMGKNDVTDFCDNAKNIDYPHVTVEERPCSSNQQKSLSASDASCGSSPLGDFLKDPRHTPCIEIDSDSKCPDIYLKKDSVCTVKCGEQDQSREALPQTKLHQDSSSYSSIETEKVSLTNKDSDTRYLESVSCKNEQEGMNSTSVTIVENQVDRAENADFEIQSQAINLERAQECTSISDTHAQTSSDSPLRLNKNYPGPLRKDSECQTEEELEWEFNDESVLNGCLSLSELQSHSVVEVEVNNTSTCIENEPGHDNTDMNCNENQKLRFSDQGNETFDAKSRITISYFNGSQMSQSVSIEKSPLYEPKKENIGVEDIMEPSSSVRTTGNNLFVIEDPSLSQSLDGDTSVLGGVGLKLACSAPENQQSNSLEDTTRQEFSPTQNYTEEKEDWIATAAAITSMQSSSRVEISLCKHLLQEGMGIDAAAEVFISHRVSLEDFENSAKEITKNEKLIVKIEGRYFPWDAAAPIILSIAAFGFEDTLQLEGSIPVEQVHKAVIRCPSDSIATPGGWRWMLPFSRTRTPERNNSAPLTPNDKLLAGAASKNFDRNLSTKNGFNRKNGRNLRVNTPTSEQLASLNLKEGKNIITFTFTTRLFGRQQVDARIFLWKWNTKIVISDVDGTITRSDVLGQFMPLVGKDWTQCGVAHLFSAIKDNGYQVLFLSARALAQACLTRQFLINIKQDGKALPDGPVVISPDGLFPSLYREVIRRTPHEFKIACLERIKALFPSHCNPFYAGFGNRDTDEISYLRVGIPKGKIFIINPKGEVVVNHRVDTKSYISLHELVHGMFPAMSYNEQEDFNSWNFWKVPVHEIDL